MRDGTFTYYTIQCRTVAENPWLKPKEPLVPKENPQWHFASFDHFSFDPHRGTGNDWKPINKKASEEIHGVWANTSRHGWWTLKYAEQALRWARREDKNGKWNSRGPYGELCCATRHEFRLVEITVSQKTETEVISKTKKRTAK